MKHHSLPISALVAIALVASACGAANDVAAGDAPTTIPLLDSTEPAIVDTTDSAEETTTTTAVETTASSADTDDSTTTTSEQATTTTKPATTSTTADPLAPYCTAYNEFASGDASVNPADPDATAAFAAAQEAAWNELAPLAPASIEAEVAVMRDFTSAFRQILQAHDYDLQSAFPELVELEEEMAVAVPRILTIQFGLIECGAEASNPEDELAVFYASLLDTPDRRTVLAELLADGDDFTLEGAMCFVERASVDMMFPLAEAQATSEQAAALNQALGVCQLSGGGS